MAYYNNGNNKKDSVNTNSITLRNMRENNFNSALAIGFWDYNMTLNFHKKLEQNIDGKNFDMDSKLTFILGPQNAERLIYCTSKLVEKLQNDFRENTEVEIDFRPFYVRTGSETEFSVIEISPKCCLDSSKKGVFINIYHKVASVQNKTAQNIFSYQFGGIDLYYDFNGDDESVVVNEPLQLYEFLEVLKDYKRSSNSAYVHQQRLVTKSERARMVSNVANIMSKLGISYGGSNNASSFPSGNSNGWGGGSNNTYDTSTTQGSIADDGGIFDGDEPF